MNKIPCSIPILTLNAKKHLERLLPVIVPVFEDVFIMDGNSTDGTQEYARSMGVRVEKQFDTDAPNQRIMDFRAMRLRLWSKAKHDWLLLLDSDMEPTKELIELTRRVVNENNVKVAHEVIRYAELPDGRVVKRALFYPNAYPHLFALSSGVTLADRAVHERLLFPADVKVIRHPEAILDPWPSVQVMREKQLRYIPMEASAVTSTEIGWVLRWIIWYNIRSVTGQFLKAIWASLIGLLRGETSLPWGYNWVFLEYRLRSMVANTKVWLSKRKK
jgi:glycosyltransferase involved in cell wall biosynthesis